MDKNSLPLEDRGQFFVKSIIKDRDTIPIDNFVFIETGQDYQPIKTGEEFLQEITLASVGQQTVLTWTKWGGTKYRWFDSKSKAFRVFADILDGSQQFFNFRDNDE